MIQKFWQLLNWPTSHGPFWPQFWTPLVTVFFEIFLKGKNWRGFRPYQVITWKEFEQTSKKWHFENFGKSLLSFLIKWFMHKVTFWTNTLNVFLIQILFDMIYGWGRIRHFRSLHFVETIDIVWIELNPYVSLVSPVHIIFVAYFFCLVKRVIQVPEFQKIT